MYEDKQMPPDGDRDGHTYDLQQDRDRLNRQARDVWDVMIAGGFYTLRAIEDATGHPQASISARLRDFRKPEFGAHTIERHRSGVAKGRYVYKLVVNRNAHLQVSQSVQHSVA